MINKIKLIQDLEELLDVKVDLAKFPYQKGNSIRIGKFVVRESKYGSFKIFNCELNAQIAETFCKTSAIALAKSAANGVDHKTRILSLDNDIQKWYNDCVFYKHNIKITKDYNRKDILEMRYDIAKRRTADAKQQLDRIIFG
jgi:hypothetical protein